MQIAVGIYEIVHLRNPPQSVGTCAKLDQAVTLKLNLEFLRSLK